MKFYMQLLFIPKTYFRHCKEFQINYLGLTVNVNHCNIITGNY